MKTYLVTFVLADNTTQFTTTTDAINIESATAEVDRWLTKGYVRLHEEEGKTETLMASFVLRYVVTPVAPDGSEK